MCISADHGRLSFMLLLLACLVNDSLYRQRIEETSDDDGDGVTQEFDCDDEDPAVYPNATEVCDGIDQDCNGKVDDDAVDATEWFADDDGDGYGAPLSPVIACSSPGGAAANADDCDDASAGSHPGASETPYDGVDQDCTGGDLTDMDSDGDPAVEAGGSDCDDADPSVSSLSPEQWLDDGMDNDCDGESYDAVAWLALAAISRIDGISPGGELGRRLSVWMEGDCIIAAAPYAESGSGVVYGISSLPVGVRTVADEGRVEGTGNFSFVDRRQSGRARARRGNNCSRRRRKRLRDGRRRPLRGPRRPGRRVGDTGHHRYRTGLLLRYRRAVAR